MDKIFKLYSLEEIANRTHISPITLKKLFDYNFENISKIKFKGFLKILENEFDYDFSKLKEKGEEFYASQIFEVVEQEPQEDKKFSLYLLVFVLLVLIGFLIFYMKTSQKEQTLNRDNLVENNLTSLNSNITEIIDDNYTEKNDTFIDEKNNTLTIENNETKFFIQENNKTEKMVIEKNDTLVIVPIQKLWFRITDLDTLKRKSYLQSTPQEINGSKNLYIEFGHGREILIFRDKNISPHSIKSVNFVLIDGQLNETNKTIKEFER